MASPASPAAQQYQGGRSVFVTIVQEVAEIRDLDPLEMPPMAEVIDLDALDRLFDRECTDGRNGQPRLEFRYAGCTVSVDATEGVDVQPIERRRDDDD